MSYPVDRTHADVLNMIREYHETMHPNQQDMTPLTATAELVEFRRKLFAEETYEALNEFNIVLDDLRGSDGTTVTAITRLVHELADVVIVAYGTAMRLGIDLDGVQYAVMRANMQKQPNPDSDGKAIKPPGFVPATVAIRQIVKEAS